MAGLDLTSLTVAFCGAEPMRAGEPAPLSPRISRPAGFDAASLLPCYGLAEATLLVTA